jgi:hypothetical protein
MLVACTPEHWVAIIPSILLKAIPTPFTICIHIFSDSTMTATVEGEQEIL